MITCLQGVGNISCERAIPNINPMHQECFALDVQARVLGRERGGLADITLEAMSAVRRHPGQNLNRWAFIAFAVRAAMLTHL
ncbi:hypothetical protein EC913_1604 [Pseudomonas sp. LP_4_YM]|nr:hypothetical protein EC913_1604 [Pseudomonas sp. LP_4_YM]